MAVLMAGTNTGGGCASSAPAAVNFSSEDTMKKSIGNSDPDFELWVLLRHTADAIGRTRVKELHKHDLSARQAATLFIIRAIGEKATPAEIARWQFRQAHSISGILSRMEKDGLIRKDKDLERKNLVRVSLTEKGHQAYQLSLSREYLNRIISSLSAEERRQMMSSLRTLRDKALEELGIEDKPPFPFPE